MNEVAENLREHAKLLGCSEYARKAMADGADEIDKLEAELAGDYCPDCFESKAEVAAMRHYHSAAKRDLETARRELAEAKANLARVRQLLAAITRT